MVFGLVSQIPQLLVARKKFSGYTWHQSACTCTSPYKYRTPYRIFDLFLSSPHAWLQRCFLSKFTMSTGLDQLATASSLTDTLKEIQEGVQTLRENVNRLKASGLGPPSQEQSTTTPRNNDQDPAQRILGTSWAEEMDILDPILDEQASDEARVMEVLPRTEACIMASFHSMPNSARRSLRSKFILSKAPVTRAPCLEKVYADSCSKSTKQADRSLVRIQALMFDAAGRFRRRSSSST